MIFLTAALLVMVAMATGVGLSVFKAVNSLDAYGETHVLQRGETSMTVLASEKS